MLDLSYHIYHGVVIIRHNFDSKNCMNLLLYFFQNKDYKKIVWPTKKSIYQQTVIHIECKTTLQIVL